MDIGTAKVTAAQRALVPHHGLDLADPDQPFTAADYQQAAFDALRAIGARRGVAVLVGGTGLYLRAVARGVPLSETGRDPAVRAGLERRVEEEGIEQLAAELRAAAPGVAANTDLSNPRRVVRALERVAVLGDVPQPVPRGYPARSVWIGMALEPSASAHRIADRARAQFEGGLLEEAHGLRARYGPDPRAFSGIGYREAFAALDGTLTRDEAVARTIARTRQLARRQRTWFRAETDVTWVAGTDINAVDRVLASVTKVLEKA